MSLLRWEFWPYWLFYTPVYLAFPFYCLRNRSLAFFTAANPGMEYGGLLDYSKAEIVCSVPERWRPRTRLIEGGASLEEVSRSMSDLGVTFPVVLKPDRGERGYNVEIVRNEEGIARYLSQSTEDVILQEYIPGDNEYGIMYSRMPGDSAGRVTSVVIKQQLKVQGDGVSSLEMLMDNDRRCQHYRPMLRREWRDQLGRVPKAGEVVVLNSVGNHSRGAIFRNGNRLISEELVELFDTIARDIAGFNIGRFDVKAESFDALLSGELSIIEINGVSSEPAHIYDPENSLFRAYIDLVRHWNLVSSICAANIRRGFRPDRIAKVVAAIAGHLSRRRKIQVEMS